MVLPRGLRRSRWLSTPASDHRDGTRNRPQAVWKQTAVELRYFALGAIRLDLDTARTDDLALTFTALEGQQDYGGLTKPRTLRPGSAEGCRRL